MQATEIADHPFIVVQFPIQRRRPMFAVDSFPAFGKPPAEVLVAAVAHELQKVTVTDRSAVDGKILQEYLMRGFFIVESEVMVRRTLVFGLWSLVLPTVTEPEQSALNLGHTGDFHRCCGGGLDGSVEL